MFSVGQIDDSKMLIDLRGRVSPILYRSYCWSTVESNQSLQTLVLFFILPTYMKEREESVLVVVGLIGYNL